MAKHAVEHTAQAIGSEGGFRGVGENLERAPGVTGANSRGEGAYPGVGVEAMATPEGHHRICGRRSGGVIGYVAQAEVPAERRESWRGEASTEAAEVAEDGARLDAIELVGISEEDEAGRIRECIEERVHQHEVHHRRLVNDDDIGRKWRLRRPAEAAVRGGAKEAVEGLRLRDACACADVEAERVELSCERRRETLCGLASRGRDGDPKVRTSLQEEAEEASYGGSLSGAGAASNNRKRMAQRGGGG